MTARDIRILHVAIAVPLARAYAFAHRPENFARWAAGLADTLQHTDGGWIADTPQGRASVRFSEPNDHGVLDHWVSLAGQPDIYVPLRMIADGDTTLVELVLFRQSGMTDAAFDRDAEQVTRDLASLKRVLEED